MTPEITSEEDARRKKIRGEIREMNANALSDRLNEVEARFAEQDKKFEALHVLLHQLKERMDTETALRIQLMANGRGPTV